MAYIPAFSGHPALPPLSGNKGPAEISHLREIPAGSDPGPVAVSNSA